MSSPFANRDTILQLRVNGLLRSIQDTQFSTGVTSFPSLSSPPKLDHFLSLNVSNDTSLNMTVTISSVPGLVWDLYLEYLVFYQPNSWVATFAYVFRIIAIILFIPILALTLLVRATSFSVSKRVC